MIEGIVPTKSKIVLGEFKIVSAESEIVLMECGRVSE
jgi:hypothetical protein